MLDELLAARADLSALEQRHRAAEARMGDPAVAADMRALERVLAEHERLLEQYEALGGATLHSRAEVLLRDLGLDEEQWQLPMELLSGGQRKLVGLARCLLADPDLLLLDEPDNHLDLARKSMLEQVIRDFGGTVVIISHDRYLLDETVSVIVELEPARRDGAAEALGGQLLGLRDAEGAGAAPAAAGLYRAAEGDRASGGGDRALQGLG